MAKETKEQTKLMKLTALIEASPMGKDDTVNIDNIIDYCEEVGALEWLDNKVRETKPNNKGEGSHKITFMEVRKDFYAKFFPKREPQPKAKNFRDKVKARFEAKKVQ